MAFCANCGSEVQGSFCQRCGASVNGGGSASPASAPAAAGGLANNMASALCYLLGFITGVIFLALAPYNTNPTIRFHAWQSIIFTVAWIVFWIAVGFVTSFLSFFALLLVPFELLISLGGFLFWLFLMWKAYQGEQFRIPFIGDIAAQQAGL